MDGSSAGKKPAPEQTATTSQKKSKPAEKEPDNEDPFAVAQSPPARKVLQCAPKPMKGRLHRVVCPMCDTQGFIPKAAVGRQVRCANRQCLVPVFEAEDKENPKTPQAPSRVTEADSPRPKKEPKAASEKNPLVMYGIVGGVLLALTLGLVAYLNKPAVDHLGPANIPMPEYVEDDPVDAPPTEVEEVPVAADFRGKATALVGEMIEAARVTSANRDKPFCRRLTGDAYLRLGLNKEADDEFAQMDKISSSARRNTAYYRVTPLITNYWQAQSSGDQAAADQRLTKAEALAAGIPKSGLLAVETTVALAAAKVQAGDVPGAMEMIEAQQPDATVALQVDAVRYGVWTATSGLLADSDRRFLPPDLVFAWNEPLKTGVGHQLAARQQWDSAITWAKALKEPLTASDTFALIAAEMVAVGVAADVQQELITASEAKDADIAFRTVSVLSQSPNSPQWEKAVALKSARTAIKQNAPEGVEAIIRAASPDLSAIQLSAEALADFAVAAASNGDDALATDAVQNIYATMVSTLKPTAELRRACRELEEDEDDVKARVGKELGLPPRSQQIRARFLSYRRGVDRQATVAEQRRLALLRLLGRVIRGGGLSAVKAAVGAEDGSLKQEICVDNLKGMLFVAAADSGQSYPEINSDGEELEVPVSRVDALPETKVIDALVAAWSAFSETSNSAAATKLEQVVGLTGVTATAAAYMTEQASLKAPSVKDQLSSIGLIKNERWREICLGIATRILTTRGMMDDVQPLLREVAKTPTQRLVGLYGIVRGAIYLSKTETPAE